MDKDHAFLDSICIRTGNLDRIVHLVVPGLHSYSKGISICLRYGMNTDKMHGIYFEFITL